MSIEPAFVHIYIPPADISIDNTLLLLHGTGGDEESLVPVAGRILPGAGVLSPRGKVLENGMPRFFRRFSEGVFDLEDLRLRTDELASFIKAASEEYGFPSDMLSAVGYSNGANMAASLMLTYPRIFRKAVLFHPMVPFVPEKLPDSSGTDVLITAGTNDPIVRPEESQKLADLLGRTGAHVDLFWQENGHSLTRDEINAAKSFLSESKI